MAALVELSGLAGTIRRTSESEQYDLAGYTEARVKDLILAVFSTPLDVPTKMIKLTFVVGGGKLVRAKYSDDLLKCKLIFTVSFVLYYIVIFYLTLRQTNIYVHIHIYM